MSNRGRSPREVTKLLVWGRAAGRCQFRHCRKPLDHELLSGQFDFNKAYLAHIVASSPDGKRGDPVLSHSLADEASNIMLMCDEHHRVIDGEKTWQHYPVEVLHDMKREHEAWVDTALSAGPESRSHILQFSAPIGPNETAVPFPDCVSAISPTRTPAERNPIEIKVKGMHYKDTDPLYWEVQPDVLRTDFGQKVREQLKSGNIQHLSVFGLAPIPLLMEMGRLLSDITRADVYELQREPVQWSWPEDKEEIHFSRTKGRPGPKKVALKLSITNDVADEDVLAALGNDASIWEIRSDIQGRGKIRHRSDLERFRDTAHRTFDEIQNQHGRDVELSVFPATPVSCSVEFGRVWQPKAQPAFDVFDYVDGKFFKRIRIEKR